MGKVLHKENICNPERGAAVQQYRWKAVDSCGRNISGVYAAESSAEAADFVRGQYGYLTLLQRERSSGSAKTFSVRQRIFGSSALRDEDKAVFFSQLALMLDSGLPLLKALAVLSERLPQKTARLCTAMQRDLQSGGSFAQSLKNRQESWGSLAPAAAAAGEEGGILCEMLEELAQYYKLQAKMKRYIKNISLYPLFLFTASMATAILFIVQVLPLFKDLYTSVNAAVPPYLSVLFAVQGFAAANLPLVLLLLFALCAAAVRYRQRLIALAFAVPFLRTQKELYLEIRFIKVLSLLLRGGIPLPQAAGIAGEALGDAFLRRMADNFAGDVLRGENPAEAAQKAKPLFGSLSAEFVSVGSETGRLPEMLARAAELLQYRFDSTLKNTKVVLEPLLLMLAAGTAAAVILAVAAPMFALPGALPGF